MIRSILIVAGAFLAFVVQPMAAKALLPVFGGAAAVWTSVLLFFQCALVLGYVYARWATPGLHTIVLAAGLLLSGSPLDSGHRRTPDWDVILVLAASIGAPYVVLAATSPLWQRWSGGAMPYRLYALSNAASFVALLGYPAFVEPWLDVEEQLRLWRIAFALFAVLSVAASLRRDKPLALHQGWSWDWWWVLLAACGTLLLGATSNQLSQEVASSPFLWVSPLAIYLISYVLAFDRPQWYHLESLSWFCALLIPGACILVAVGMRAPFLWHFPVYCLTLFVGLWMLHGELARRRPPPESSGAYYIALAVGGAIGGMLVAVVAPRVFHTYAEYPLSLAVVAAVAVWSLLESQGRRFTLQLGVLGMAMLTPVIVMMPSSAGGTELAEKRNFYGALRVTEREGIRRLAHGATTHGTQFTDAVRRKWATTYYGPGSGVALALEEQRRLNRPLRIGVIGLGVGTLAAYAKPGDTVRFYELNPQVEQLARQYFTYLHDAGAPVDVVLGDARLQLASAADSSQFDLLVLDAFSSDAIPVHLLTAEAGEIYKRHLAPDGLLAIHISNLTVNLEPVVRGMVRRIKYHAVRREQGREEGSGIEASQWMIARPGVDAPVTANGVERLWTDRRAALWPLLR